jgi:hypothetical protein
MRTRYNETEPPARQSNVPLRASAHPSALAAVRPRYPRGLNDLERVTHLDVSRLPTLPQRSEAVRKTHDPITEDNVRDIEHILAIDEIDTFPPDVQARLRPRLRRAAYDPSTLSDMDTWPTSSVQGMHLAARRLPTDVGQITQSQGGSTWHYVDKVRWWLLSPGRLEFVLCIIGVIVLIGVTSLFLLAIALSLGVFKY